jgi:hypothetical protein
VDEQHRLIQEIEKFHDAYVATTGQLTEVNQTDWFALPSFVETSSLPGQAANPVPFHFTMASELAKWRVNLEQSYREIDFAYADAQRLGIWLLTENSALLLAEARRFKTDGSQLPRTRHLYILIRGDQGWRILALLSVDPQFSDSSAPLSGK